MLTEQVVAERLGVSRVDLRKARVKMERGPMWDVVANAGVVFTEAGLEALERVLRAEVPKKEKEVVPVQAVAKKTDWPNRQMIVATIGGADVRCRVRDARLYTPGMTFEAVLVQEPDLFEETMTPLARGRC